MENLDSAATIVQQLMQVYHLLRRTFIPILDEANLSFPDMMVLKAITHDAMAGATGAEAEPGRRLTDIGRELGLPLSTLTSVVDRLARLGHVERVPSLSDRRSIRVHPTARWTETARRLQNRIDAEMSAVLAAMPDACIAQLKDNLARLASALRERLDEDKEE